MGDLGAQEPAEPEHRAESGPQHVRRRHRWHRHLHRNRALSATTKIMVTTVGGVVVMAGLIMLVTPGPGLVSIVAGLAILATEWDWADRWLSRARERLDAAREAAARMDPIQRRRRILAGAGGAVAAGGAGLLYVLLAGWPSWVIAWWNRTGDMLGLAP